MIWLGAATAGRNRKSELEVVCEGVVPFPDSYNQWLTRPRRAELRA